MGPSEYDCEWICVQNAPYEGRLELQDTLLNGHWWWASSSGDLGLAVDEITGIGLRWFYTVPIGYMMYEGEISSNGQVPTLGDWTLVYDQGVLGTYSNVTMTCNECIVYPSPNPSVPPQESNVVPGLPSNTYINVFLLRHCT